MNFIQSIKTCFKKYANFKGRATRSEYWWFQLFALVIYAGMLVLDVLFGFDWESAFTPFSFVSELLLVVPTFAVTSRRLHDIGWTGWLQMPVIFFYLDYLAPIIPQLSDSAFVQPAVNGGVFYMILIFITIKGSQARANKYGPDPTSPDMGEVFS